MASLFVSHASADKAFALRLAHHLRALGHTVWVDAQEIPIGDSIPQRVEEALEHADWLIVVLSQHGTASRWCAHEWRAKYWEEVVTSHTCVLPVLLEDCRIPFFLRPKRCADFRSDYVVGFAQLAIVLHEHSDGTAPGGQHLRRAIRTEQRETADIGPSAVSLGSAFCYTDNLMKRPGRLTEINVELDIPYLGKIAGVWQPDEREQDAAWELYVELVTRISVAELAPSEGLLRESLSSLYSMFTTTRQILRSSGPDVARPKDKSQFSFGYLAITMLNFVVRPVLAKWHPLLLDYEQQRASLVSAVAHEAAWEHAEELRRDLNGARLILLNYTKLLAQIARVPTTMLP
ncbi:MAG: toll/interleukin-1 receptor domain-containing protein [Dehalococcoidia bacterium]